MNDDLGNLIREHYESQPLPADLAGRIRAEGRLAHVDWRRGRRNFMLAGLGIAAALVVGMFCLQPNKMNTAQVNEQIEELARRVAMSHTLHKPGAYDHESNDFEDLEGKLQANFRLTAVESKIRKRFTLKGCSNCQTLGKGSVHFNAEDRETGRSGSLFIGALDESMASLSPTELEVAGVGIRLWKDDEHLYVFAATI